MIPCQWATCSRPSTGQHMGWRFCTFHMKEHLRMYRAGHFDKKRPRKVAPCGTRSGFQRHKREGERPCEPCLTSERTYQAARHIPKPPRELRPCGTHAAYMRHKLRKEAACEACVEAERAYQQARKRERRAA